MKKNNYVIEFELLILIIEEVLGISKEDLIAKTRKRPIVELRMICSNLLKENNPKITVNEMGAFLDINHSTVTYHLGIQETLIGQRNGQYKAKYQTINGLYKNRILMVGDNLKSRLLERKKKLENELLSVNDVLEAIKNESTIKC